MKEQNLGLEVARDFFIEINHCAIQKSVGMLDFVIFDIELALNRYFL